MADETVSDNPADSLPSDTAATDTGTATNTSAADSLDAMYDFGPEDTPLSSAAGTTGAAAGAGSAANDTATAQPEQPTLSPALQQRAAQLGYTPETLAAIKDPLVIENLINTSEKAVLQGMAFVQQQQIAAAQAARAPQLPQLPPEPKPPAPLDEAALRQQLAAKNFDESLIEAHIANAREVQSLRMQLHEQAMQGTPARSGNWRRSTPTRARSAKSP
jgi:hypothetical protein